MKTLLITNPNQKTKNYIQEVLRASWNCEMQKDKRKRDKDFLKESDYFRIIDSESKYRSLDSGFIPDLIVVVPELNWNNDDVNEGYDKAKDLALNTYKAQTLQFVFLSVLERSSLLKIVESRNKSLVEAFPHECLLNNSTCIQFEYYSNVHYWLIKHLAISLEGKLQKVSHEMDSLKENIKKNTQQVEVNKIDLISKLEELSLFQQWTEKKIVDKIFEIKNATSNADLVNASREIEIIIDEINLKLSLKDNKQEQISRIKSNYKVLVIEDDNNYRSFFIHLLSKFYNDVSPDANNKILRDKDAKVFSIINAKETIIAIGKKYNIFFLDLFYKDDSGGWLNFNGLDLYLLIKKVNPFAVIRLVTSLPRGIVAKLVSAILIDTYKPNSDEVYTKKYGYDALRDSIVESIEKLNEECSNKGKLKSAWAPFPKEGFFKGENINNLMHEMMFGQKKEFDLIAENALGLFNKYKDNQLTLNTSDWGTGSLPSPKMKNSCTDDYFKKRLPNILVHRLIALDEALKSSDYRINYGSYRSIMSNISKLSSPDKGYFQTKLGFNGTEYSKEVDRNVHYFQIELINLFPYENQFLATKLKEMSNLLLDKQLKDINSELDELFKKILKGEDATLYEIWEDLKLNFNPYKSQEIRLKEGDEIDELKLPDNLTLRNACDFFESLIKNYNQQFVPDIVSYITTEILQNYTNFEEKFNVPLFSNVINRLIDKEEKVDLQEEHLSEHLN